MLPNRQKLTLSPFLSKIRAINVVQKELERKQTEADSAQEAARFSELVKTVENIYKKVLEMEQTVLGIGKKVEQVSDGYTPVKGVDYTDGVDGESVDKGEVITEVTDNVIPLLKKTVEDFVVAELEQKLARGLEKVKPDYELIAKKVVQLLPAPKHVVKTEQKVPKEKAVTPEDVFALIKKTKLSIEDIDGLKNYINEFRTNNLELGSKWRGGGDTVAAGSGVSITRDANGHAVISASSQGILTPISGSVDGSNTVFVYSSAPQLVTVDGGRTMQKVSSDGTVNWTGTTTIVLTLAPGFDIIALT